MNWKLNSHKIEYVTTMIFIKSKNIFQNYKSIPIHFQEWNKNSFFIYEHKHSWTLMNMNAYACSYEHMNTFMFLWTRLCSYEHVLMNVLMNTFLWTRLCSYEHMAHVLMNTWHLFIRTKFNSLKSFVVVNVGRFGRPDTELLFCLYSIRPFVSFWPKSPTLRKS